MQCLDCIFSAGWGWSDPNPVVDCILSYTLSVTILMNILHYTAAATAHTTPGNISAITDAIKYNFYISGEIDSSLKNIRFNIGFHKCNNITLWHPSEENISIL